MHNPDTLRIDSGAINFIGHFIKEKKIVAAICHAPWLLVETGAIKGKELTSWASLKTDLENAGAIWIDQAVVRDSNIITSRCPEDIPQFCKSIEERLNMNLGL